MSRELGTLYADPPVTGQASGAITRGLGVNYHTDRGHVELADAAGQAIDGIALETVADGNPVAVLQAGRYELAVCGAAIGALHTDLAVDASGKFVAATTGDVIVGRNLTTTASADEKFCIELDQGRRTAA